MSTPPQTLLDELEVIDAALLEGTATRKQEKRGQEIVTLANAAPEPLDVLADCIQLWDDLYANMADEGEVVIWSKARAAFAKASTIKR
jgi:hypothetical protein